MNALLEGKSKDNRHYNSLPLSIRVHKGECWDDSDLECSSLSAILHDALLESETVN
jgi:hypothetical protein